MKDLRLTVADDMFCRHLAFKTRAATGIQALLAPESIQTLSLFADFTVFFIILCIDLETSFWFDVIDKTKWTGMDTVCIALMLCLMTLVDAEIILVNLGKF